MQEATGQDPELLLMAAGFGGGIGRCQAVCGAISGGVIALAVKNRLEYKDTQEARTATSRAARELYRGFEQTFGRTDCRSLTGHDFSTPEGYQRFTESGVKQERCYNYVTFVVQKVTAEPQS